MLTQIRASNCKVLHLLKISLNMELWNSAIGTKHVTSTNVEIHIKFHLFSRFIYKHIQSSFNKINED